MIGAHLSCIRTKATCGLLSSRYSTQEFQTVKLHRSVLFCAKLDSFPTVVYEITPFSRSLPLKGTHVIQKSIYANHTVSILETLPIPARVSQRE
jgi:hypothetical protein